MRLSVDVAGLADALGARMARRTEPTLALPADCGEWLGYDLAQPLRLRRDDRNAIDTNEPPSAWILREDQPLPTDGAPVLTTDAPLADLRYRLEHYLDRQLLPRLAPGTMVVVHDTGVLIRGPAGCGKSQCALELVDRGHGLVGDDAIELRAGYQRRLEAHAAATTAGMLHLRGIGTIPMGDYFPGRVLTRHTIDLVISLDADGGGKDPMADGWSRVGLMGRHLPRLALAPQRPLALLIEVATRIKPGTRRNRRPSNVHTSETIRGGCEANNR